MMKRIQELHKKHNKYPEYKNFYLAYNYSPKTDDWEFAGYKCVKCGRVLSQTGVVPRHEKNCKEINKTRTYKTVEIDPSATVLDTKGNVWKPLDFNQI